jgi:predicted nucleic acid-binding protein
VLSALRRVVAAGEASAERAEEAIDDLRALPVQRYGHDVLVPRSWEMRENLSAYDASYVALAEAIADEPATLVTADARLARAVGAHTRVRVIVAG